MATQLGASIRLGADSKKLRRDLAVARRQWKSYARDVGASLKTMARTAGVAAGGIAVGFGLATKKALDFADATAKAARNARLSIVDYQKLQHAFDLAGVSTKSEKAISTLSRSIYDFGRELSTQVEAFDAIGLKFEDFADLTPADSFYLVLDSLRGVKDETKQLAIAQVLLGRSGKELGTLLAQTNAQLRAQGDELEELGGVITAFGSDAELLNDEMDKLSKVSMASFINGLDDAFGGGFGTGGQRAAIIKDVGEAIRGVSSALGTGVRWIWQNRDGLLALVKVWLAYKVTLAAVVVLQGVYAASAFVKTIALQVQAMGGLVAVTKAAAIWSKRLGLILLKFVAIPAAIAGIYFTIRNLGFAIRDNWDKISNAASSLGDVIKGYYDRFIHTIAKGIIEVTRDALTGIRDMVNSAIDGLNWVLDFVNKIPGVDIDKFGQFTAFDSVIATTDALAQIAQDKIAEITSDIIAAQERFGVLGNEAFSGVADSFKTEMKAVIDDLANAYNAVIDGIKSKVEAHAPWLIDILDIEGTLSDIGSLDLNLPPPPGQRGGEGTGGDDIDWDSVLKGVNANLEEITPATDFEKIGTEVVTNMGSALGNALKDGDWKSLGSTFISVVQNALISSLTEKAVGAVLKGIGIAHEGTVVPGSSGQESLWKLEAGEVVLSAEQARAIGASMNQRRGSRPGSAAPNITVPVGPVLGTGFRSEVADVIVERIENIRMGLDDYQAENGYADGY